MNKSVLCVEPQTLQLPPEAMSILTGATQVWLTLDTEKRTITISVTDPDILENNAILDQLAALNEDLSLEEYGAPVPESFLTRRGKADTGEGNP